MKRFSNLFAPDLTRQLVSTGFLPVDTQDAAITHPAPPWLHISQVGGLVESQVFDPDCESGTGCILDLHIAVDLGSFSIWGWELDLPWKDPEFRFLPEPTGESYPYNMYKFPGRGALMFSRDNVINHRHRLQRGHGLDGLLLGFSFQSIPDSYKHGAQIEASLILIDEMRRAFSTPVQLWADRSAKIDRQRRKKNTRGPLFSRRDGVKDELVQK
jgi:hypothetical protein